jgi:hypothetical protein
MLKARLLLTSMLFVAFLPGGRAQDAGGKPAELEISLARSAGQARGYRVSGAIPLNVPNGDDTFVVTASLPAYWHLSAVNRKCGLNRFAIALKIVGRRSQDRLKLALSLSPDVRWPPCVENKAIETISEFPVNTGDLRPTEFTLSVADGSKDERPVESSSHPGQLMGKVTLHLACPAGSGVSESAPMISVLPNDTVQWPPQFDDSKTSAELSALAATPSGVVGLTRPSKPYPPIALFRGAIRHSALGHGFCFWVKSIQVEFAPVEILIANKYQPGTCEYQVIREHEMLHYQDIQRLFMRYEALVILAIRQAGLPTIERPTFVGSVTEGTSLSQTRLQNKLQPIYALMEKTLLADANARDGPQQRMLSWSQCPKWYARLTGVRSRAFLLLDLDPESLQLVPERTASALSKPRSEVHSEVH